MLFRHIKEHVKNENWFAVAVDFFIVVIGVFLGIQIGNWNEERQDNLAYEAAKTRLSAEIQSNLNALDNLDKEIENYLTIAGKAFDTLLSCEESQANRSLVNTGISAVTGTYGIRLRSSALEEMTSSESLLAKQTVSEREQLARAKYYMDLVTREASFAETLPLQQQIQSNPIIGLGKARESGGTYTGVDFSRKQRSLELMVPINEACKNNQLIKSFYTWERWQGVLPALSRIIRKELLETQNFLNTGNKNTDNTESK